MDSDPHGSSPRLLAAGTGGRDLSQLAAKAYRPARVELDEALRRNWLEIWYQPQIDLNNSRVIGAEALARIRHPGLGVLLPKSFLPSVPDGGMTKLTEYAIATALRDWCRFDAAGFNLRLSVNLPVESLQQLAIGDIMNKGRPAADHWPGLMLEVKQDQIVRHLDPMLKLAGQLQTHRAFVSIDNFNGRYVSLSHLRELPFAQLKLDHDIVKNCATSAANAVICHTAIDFAHRVGLRVMGEGIESTADMQALRQMGCDGGQGVSIAPPLPARDLLELLQHPPKPAKIAAARDTDGGRKDGPLGFDSVA